MEIRRRGWSDWLAKFNEVGSADPFYKGKSRHSRKNEMGKGRRMEAASARAPKSASRTWVKFEIGHPPLLSPSPLDGASLPHACYLRSPVPLLCTFHASLPARQLPRPSLPLPCSLAKLSPREYSYRVPEIGEAEWVDRERGVSQL